MVSVFISYYIDIGSIVWMVKRHLCCTSAVPYRQRFFSIVYKSTVISKHNIQYNQHVLISRTNPSVSFVVFQMSKQLQPKRLFRRITIVRVNYTHSTFILNLFTDIHECYIIIISHFQFQWNLNELKLVQSQPNMSASGQMNVWQSMLMDFENRASYWLRELHSTEPNGILDDGFEKEFLKISSER